MGEAESMKAGKKRSEAKIGHEFRPKVLMKSFDCLGKTLIVVTLQKAGGDLKKKGGPDPYAYVPLGQAAKKRTRRNGLGLAGKR